MARAAVVFPQMCQNIVFLFISKFLKWVLLKVVVEIRQVNKSTAEAIDRLCPALKLLRNVHHLTIRHIPKFAIDRVNLPFLSSQGGID